MMKRRKMTTMMMMMMIGHRATSTMKRQMMPLRIVHQTWSPHSLFFFVLLWNYIYLDEQRQMLCVWGMFQIVVNLWMFFGNEKKSVLARKEYLFQPRVEHFFICKFYLLNLRSDGLWLLSYKSTEESNKLRRKSIRTYRAISSCSNQFLDSKEPLVCG